MYQKRTNKKTTKDSAVSPVVGVMLMLVVTIIIAAVVAVFASGVISTKGSTPTGSFTTLLTDDSLTIKVDAVSEPISTNDIKIIVSIPNGQSRQLVAAVKYPYGFNINAKYNASGFKDSINITENTPSTVQAGNWSNFNQWFGNYSISAGTVMSVSGDALKTALEGGTSVPRVITEIGLSGTSWTKGVLVEALANNQEAWESVFDLEHMSLTNPGDFATMLKYTASSLAGTKIADIEPYKSIIAEAGSNNVYMQTSDSNWQFGKTCTYGDGYGHITYLSDKFTTGWKANGQYKGSDFASVSIVYLPTDQIIYSQKLPIEV